MKIDRRQVYDKYLGHCAYCGEKIEFGQMQVDHIRPKSRFSVGSFHRIPKYHVDDIQNLNPSCRVCNYWKHNFTLDEFRHEIESQPKRLMRDSGKFRFAEKHKMVKITNNPVIFYFDLMKEFPSISDVQNGEG